MKVAIIGTGHIAHLHGSELNRLGYKIDVAIDSNLDRARLYAEEWNVRQVSDDINDAFQEHIEVVHICTPPSAHYDLIKKAIKNNKHVVCEKPLTLDSKESEELLALAKKSNLVIAVNFNVRYHKGLSKIKENILSESFGEVRLINASYLQQFHILPTEYSWRYDSKISNNLRAISEIGSHMIDLITYLTGQNIVEVSSVTQNYVPKRYLKDSIMYEEEVEDSEVVEVVNEDAAIVSFRLENGAIGNVTLSEISHGKTNEVSMHIDGSKKSTWWCNETPYHTFTAKKNEGVKLEIDSFEGGHTDTFSKFFEEVYSDITSNSKDGFNYPSIKDGHYNVIVCEAILESSRKNSKWIKINERM